MKRKREFTEELKRESGITLVVLIISIVILIILAAVVIKSIMDMDIIGLATDSAVKYAKQQVEEEEMFNELYSKILVADNDNAEITISVKDLETLINEKVQNAMSEQQKNIQNTIDSLQNEINVLKNSNMNNIHFANYEKELEREMDIASIDYTAGKGGRLVCWSGLLKKNEYGYINVDGQCVRRRKC